MKRFRVTTAITAESSLRQPKIWAGASALQLPAFHKTNGLAERSAPKAEEGAIAALHQAGLHRAWWTYGVEFYSFAHNIAETGGNSAYSARHKCGGFEGMRIPFGALVDFMPQPDQKIKAFGKETIRGSLVGYYLLPGGFGPATFSLRLLNPS